MRVVFASAFRNFAARAEGYMTRVAQFREHARWDVSVLAIEGDSTDRTLARMVSEAFRWEIPLVLKKCNHGGPVFGSVESEERFRALSKVCDAVFSNIPDYAEIVFYVESDLLWTPDVARKLTLHAAAGTGGIDVHAPLVMAGDLFYDVWGYRGLDGRRFSPFAPFFPGFAENSPLEVGSVGSCLVMPAPIARQCRVRNEYCLVGWCEDARSRGYRIGVHGDLLVRHPA